MEMESAILQMFANRIEEASSLVMQALEENTTARNLCRERKYDKVEPMLLVSHDHLLIAATTLRAIKEFVPNLSLKGNAEADA